MTFNRKTAKEIKRVTKKLSVGDNLHELSGGIEAYRNFIITAIDGADNSLEFLNGRKLFVGQTFGNANEKAFRLIQIRKTIQAHLERDNQLFGRGELTDDGTFKQPVDGNRDAEITITPTNAQVDLVGKFFNASIAKFSTASVATPKNFCRTPRLKPTRKFPFMRSCRRNFCPDADWQL